MASLVSRLVAGLVAVVAVLQLVHLVLLNKLESRRLSELHHLQNHVAGGKDHPPEYSRLPGSIINGDSRTVGQMYGRHDGYDIPDYDGRNGDLANKLFGREETTIVDSGGEYRIIFDVAGPESHFVSDSNFPIGKENFISPVAPLPAKLQNKQTDDFTIDEEHENFEPIPQQPPTDVTLVTQGDLENVRRYLIPLVERWLGPISLGLFAPNSTVLESALGFISKIRLCHQMTRQLVSFHLVFPLVETLSENSNKTRIVAVNWRKRRKIMSEVDTKDCSKFLSGILPRKTSPEKRPLVNYDSRVLYPINLMRNVAKKRVQTKFSFVTDIDMLPSSGLRSRFTSFALEKQLGRSNNADEGKTVYVVPAFESKNGETPADKRELLALIEKFQVRPFYFDICWKCQVHTDYETWQRELGSKLDHLSVLFEVLWKDPWEPFFISDNFVPQYDERFRQYGFNRISMLCELHVAGYKFAVLNDAFLIHRGYKTSSSFHAGKPKDLEVNRANFRQFKNELKEKYPHSTRRCY